MHIHVYMHMCAHTHTDTGGLALVKVEVMGSSTILVFLLPSLEHLQRTMGYGDPLG